MKLAQFGGQMREPPPLTVLSYQQIIASSWGDQDIPDEQWLTGNDDGRLLLFTVKKVAEPGKTILWGLIAKPLRCLVRELMEHFEEDVKEMELVSSADAWQRFYDSSEHCYAHALRGAPLTASAMIASLLVLCKEKQRTEDNHRIPQ